MKNSFYCRVMRKEDEWAAVQCIVHAFTQSEPMTSFLKISIEDFSFFVTQMFNQIVDDNLSIVACDEKENIIGVRLVANYGQAPSFLTLPESMYGIIALLDSFHPVTLDSRQCIHLKMLGVREQAQNKGIAQQLLIATFEHAKEKGYDYALVEASSKITQHIFINKFQFTVLKKIHYQTFRYENKNIFAHLPNETHCALLGKYL